MVWLFGCGPLLAFVLLDFLGFNVSDNPIGPGLLAMLAAPIGLMLVLAGVVQRWTMGESSTDVAETAVGGTQEQVEAKLELTSEQNQYLDGYSVGAGWGLIYYIYMSATGVFFRHLPANFVWTNVMRQARRQVWENGEWANFDEFKAKNDQIDKSATAAMVVGLPLVILLIIL